MSEIYESFLKSQNIVITGHTIPGVTDAGKITITSAEDRVRNWCYEILKGSPSKTFDKKSTEFKDFLLLLSFRNDESKRKKVYSDIDQKFKTIRAFKIFTSRGYPDMIIMYDEYEDDDMSWRKCARGIYEVGKGSSNQNSETKAAQWATLSAVLRTSVSDDIAAFKKSQELPNGGYRCENTQEIVYGREVHVDHHSPQFIELAHDWIDSVGIDNIEVVDSGFQKGNILAEPYLSSWKYFHNKNAKLRILKSRENLSRKRAKRRTP